MLQNMVQLWGCRCGWFQSSKDIYHMIPFKTITQTHKYAWERWWGGALKVWMVVSGKGIIHMFQRCFFGFSLLAIF